MSTNHTPSFCGSKKLNSWNTKPDLQYDHDDFLTKFFEGGNKPANPKEDFEFLAPQNPVKKREKDAMSIHKKLPKEETVTSNRIHSISARPSTGTLLKSRMSEVPYRICSQENPEKLSNILTATDVSRNMLIRNDRVSCSSADSSLGILSPDTLKGAIDYQPIELDEVGKFDLSQRLAEKLKLDTSKIQGLHFSNLASSHLSTKDRQSRENKEKQLSGLRKSSDYYTSYSSSDSSSQLTAKEVSRSLDGKDISGTDLPPQAPQTKPLTERNCKSARESFLSSVRKETQNKATSLHQKVTKLKERANIELDKIKIIKEKRKMSTNHTPSFCGSKKLNSWNTKPDLQYDHDDFLTKFFEGGNKPANPKEDFEFLAPQNPVKKREKDAMSIHKKLPKEETVTSNRIHSISARPSTGTLLKSRMSEVPYRICSQENPEKLSNILTATDVSRNMLIRNDRVSCSSADSSLGILSPDTLKGAIDYQPIELDEVGKFDLSQRLAEKLKLDTSKIQGLHFSNLASSHLSTKDRQSRENKEKQLSGLRKSSDYYTSYSSSDSSSQLTAKEVSRSLDGKDISGTDLPPQAPQTKPLTERNCKSARESFLSSVSDDNRDSIQFGQNPFGDFSGVRLSSEVFESGATAAEKLDNDEAAWSGSQSSLSGIYADTDFSFSTQGHKQSISSFLRSGSGPLGSLEKTPEGERPSFGLPANSPERKCPPKPILPPTKDKLTFCLTEQASKETSQVAPWNLESLLRQYSGLHRSDSLEERDAGTDVMENKNVGYVEILEKLKASSKSRNPEERTKNKQRDSSVISLDDSALSDCSTSNQLKSIPAVVTGGNFCCGYESDESARYSSSFGSYNSINDEIEPVLHKGSQMVLEEQQNFTRHKHECDSLLAKETQQFDGNKTPLNSRALDPSVVEDSVSESICNVTDFEGERDECVCVMIPESMDFDIFNYFSTPQQYSISKACYVDGRRQDNAALVYLRVTELILQPGEQQVVNVTVAAVVGKTIKIKLAVTRTDLVTKEKATDNVYGKIVAECPKIDLASPSTTNMKPVIGTLESDLCKEYKSIIELRNSGHSTVPLKLSLASFADTTYAGMFYFDLERRQSVNLSIGPGQTVRQAVFCQTPSIFELSQTSGVVPVATRVDVFLDTPAQAQLPPITTVSCHAKLASNFFSAPGSLMVSVDTLANCRLYNSSPSLATLRACTSADFSVQPTSCVIQPFQTTLLTVSYTGGANRRGTLTLCAVEQQTKFNISLHGTSIPSSQCSSNSVTPVQSRASSSSSPCSSVGSVGTKGALSLKCKYKKLVWGGCILQRRVVKTCSIMNQNTFREKLQLTVTDQNNCFKLPLYGFEGKARVSFEGPIEGPDQRMWLYRDSETLSTSFNLTNDGDFNAFVRISEGRSAPSVGGGLSILPPELNLPPQHSANVEITLSFTPERLEYLLAQPSHSGICVTEVSVAYGDESTRQRLVKLSRTNPHLADKLPRLSHNIQINLDTLDDPQSCAEKLFLDDIHEKNIWIMVKRSALQNLYLDTTVKYQDLSSTIIKD